MAGEILYFLHRHFKAVLVLGTLASLGLLGGIANALLRLLHLGA